MKSTLVAIIFAGVLIGGAFLLSNKPNTGISAELGSNVSTIDGKQVITIDAKGGYAPAITYARAGVPTVLRVATTGTFDCSSALTIPAIGYKNNLPPSGTTDIEVPAQKSGTTMRGLCAMGMYNFQVQFN
jgi:plastocyanin domain-containing protein